MLNSRPGYLVVPLLFFLTGCTTIAGLSARTPQSPDGKAARLAQIGELFESQGRTANAIASYEQALAVDPANDRLVTRIASLRRLPSEASTSPPEISVGDDLSGNSQPATQYADTTKHTSVDSTIQLSSWQQFFRSKNDTERFENEDSDSPQTDDSELIGRESPI